MKFAKHPSRKPRVQRTWFEMDLSECPDLDLSGPLPTPTTHPDAFYRVSMPAYPATIVGKRHRRKKPHQSLSRTQLRKRLSHLGLRGRELRRVMAEILTGPRLLPLKDGSARVFMKWDVNTLRSVFGRRVARAVLRFVQLKFVVMDEMWRVMQSPVVQSVLDAARSRHTHCIKVSQSIEDFKGLNLQELTFPHSPAADAGQSLPVPGQLLLPKETA